MLENNKWYLKKKSLDQGNVARACGEVGVEWGQAAIQPAGQDGLHWGGDIGSKTQGDEKGKHAEIREGAGGEHYRQRKCPAGWRVLCMFNERQSGQCGLSEGSEKGHGITKVSGYQTYVVFRALTGTLVVILSKAGISVRKEAFAGNQARENGGSEQQWEWGGVLRH